MENLLNKLLFLAQRENQLVQGKTFTPTDISSLIDQLIEKQRLIDKEHNYKILRNHSLILNIDRDLILQCLRELLKNSSKYSLPGKKIIIDSYTKREFHIIKIIDSGKGISEENIKFVFDRFHIEDESRNRQKNSFGLGLSIVKEIIELHNGKIDIKSSIGKGTSVSIFLPLS
jgi:signal transduction histidine kinase